MIKSVVLQFLIYRAILTGNTCLSKKRKLEYIEIESEFINGCHQITNGLSILTHLSWKTFVVYRYHLICKQLSLLDVMSEGRSYGHLKPYHYLWSYRRLNSTPLSEMVSINEIDPRV